MIRISFDGEAICQFRQSPSPRSSPQSGHIYCNREIYFHFYIKTFISMLEICFLVQRNLISPHAALLNLQQRTKIDL